MKSKNRTRLRIEVTGAVQGVGFRPFVYRLANKSGLTGWVRNSVRGVEIEIEGDLRQTQFFLAKLDSEAPPNSVIRRTEEMAIPLVGDSGFEIQVSGQEMDSSAGEVLPDLATCADCLREIFDPEDRRYLYPFTNCTNCGPRYSIVRRLPYDRENTTMASFAMCPECLAEYRDPENRRFHAQPNACPKCGPHVDLSLANAAEKIKNGQILAVKGVGGFHLFIDARDEQMVHRLRKRKHRPDKPFAVMFPNLNSVNEHCEVNDDEEALLTSSAAPIVLLRRHDNSDLASNLAPDNPWLGAILPYSPLHHVLMYLLGFPVVATSGNLSDEPICIENDEAQNRLTGIADAFLLHNRPIERAVDDSVACVVADRELLLRRSRGYAPSPIEIAAPLPSVLALGGDLKNTIAISSGNRVFLSQHHGDLGTAASLDAFTQHIVDLPKLCCAKPLAFACDLHPGYHSSGVATNAIRVQHHHAHIAACLAEHGIEGPVLGVAWDGTGYGTDGTIWGGEFLIATQSEYERFTHLRSFPLPGGEKAVREPRLAALGLLHEAGIAVEETSLGQAFEDRELEIAKSMLRQKINSPRTTSAGRLFDAFAALLGLRLKSTFEGQAAMDLEFCLARAAAGSHRYDYKLADRLGDWTPILSGMREDLANGTPVSEISASIHDTMVEMIVQVANTAKLKTVALSGGCFQNRYLLERTIHRLRECEFTPVWPRQVPPNDGGLALGQAIIAARTLDPICA